ncbi:Cullin-associated NEDD8-dissociated protein 1 [Quaeritorhiza haematococci]|nr:Cullin-associated NEDD8-dissociated protein 1 [Quaeritorhiza haematococci]
MSSSAYMVAALLEKMTSNDSDFRYMATNDLMNELQKENFNLEDITERKIVAAIIRLLDDKNGEVQNLAVKCLAPLVKKVHEPQLQEIVDQLCNLLGQKREELRDIASIGLKTVIVEIPPHATIAGNIVKRLVPKLIHQLNNTQDIQMDTIDILSEVLGRFGHLLSPTGSATGAAPPGAVGGSAAAAAAVAASGALELQKSIQNTLLPLLNHSRAAVRKRTTIAIGNLVTNTPDDLFGELVKKVIVEMKEKEQSKDYEKLRTLIGCVASLSRYSSHRLGQYLTELLPLVLKYASFEDDELMENCLQCLESFVLRCPTEITPHIQSVIALALQHIKYDPNYDDGEDDEDDMDVDGSPKGGDDDDDDADADEEDEEEEDDDEVDYSDDDDVSWKVRRASSKLLASIIGTRSELLGEVYKTVAPVLIGRFKEREESVRVDVFNTFVVLVRQTGATAGRAGGRGAGAGYRELLRNQVPRLSKALAKQLSGKSIATRQTGFTLLRELVMVLQGGLDAQIGLFIPAIESSLSTTGGSAPGSASGTRSAVGGTSTTNSNLKIETLEFLRGVFVTHAPEVFHKHLPRLVPPVVAACSDKFYKITSEALLVAVELVRVIRPFPSVKPAQGTTFSVPALPAPTHADYISQIYRTVLDRLSTTDVDLEVKERSIIALGTLLYQTGDLLPQDEVQGTVLPLLIDRLKNELTRLTTTRVIRTVAESPLLTITPPAVDLVPLLPEVIPEVASYLRKSHRQLRVASLQCLETLIRHYGGAAHGNHIPPEHYSAIVSELRPMLVDSDLHILPLAMNLLCVVLVTAGTKEVLNQIREEVVLPHVVRLVVDSPHLVSAGAGLEALMGVWKCLVKVGGSGVF